MSKTKRIWLLAAVLAFALRTAIPDEENEGGSKVEPRETRAVVSVAAAREGALVVARRYLARVEIAPQSPSSLPARSGGIVTAVLVQEGDRVAKGAALVRLDSQVARAGWEKAKALLDAAQNDSEAAMKGGLDLQQQSLDSAATVAESLAERLRADAERQKTLRSKDLSAEKRLIEAEAAAEAAAEEAAIARKRADAYRAYGREAESRRLAAALAQAQAEECTARIDLDSAKIDAPAAGRIARVSAGVGARLEAGAEVVRLIPDDAVALVFLVPPREASDLELAAPVDAGAVRARIATIPAGVEDKTGLVRVRASVESGGEGLRLGQFISVNAATRLEAKGIILPASALSYSEDQPLVAAVKAELAHQIPVEILGRFGGEIVVKGEGLAAGAVVVTDGNDNLPDGARVVVEKDTR